MAGNGISVGPEYNRQLHSSIAKQFTLWAMTFKERKKY
jgi:hypothetical protein